jgi:rod shape-determining protein MreD
MSMLPPFVIRLIHIALLCGAAWVALGFELAPVTGGARSLPAPDFLFCALAVWVARRPEAAPVALVFALGLLRDLLGGGAIGAGALALMLAVEGLRAQGAGLQRRGFLVEWLTVGLWATALLAMHWLALAVVFAPTPLPGDLGLRLVLTIATYPAAALALRWVARIGRRDGADRATPRYGRGA